MGGYFQDLETFLDYFWSESDMIDFLLFSILKKIRAVALEDETIKSKLKRLRLDDRAFISVLMILYTNEFTDI